MKPKLDIGRLAEIRACVDTPLVLHGGSEACKDALEKGMDYLNMRNLKVEYIKQAVMKKMKLFGCDGKA